MSSQATSPKPDVRFASTGSSPYAILLALFCVIIVISNIVAAKPIEIGSGDVVALGPIRLWPLIVDGGLVLFPLAYVIGDVLSEVYGFRAARRAVLTGFACSLLAVGTFLLVGAIPGAAFYENQAAYDAVLGPVGQIVAASIVGYVAGQLTNAWVLTRMKARTAERGLVGRLLASTGVGEVVDTFLFCAIAASAIGVATGGDFLNYFVVGVVLKVAFEVVLLPVTVTVIGRLKKSDATY